MRRMRIAAIGVSALVALASVGVLQADEQPSAGFSLPSLPGGMPFIPVGPQPGAVPVNSELWRSVVDQFGPPMSAPQLKIVEDAVAELSRAAGNVAPKGGYRATLLDTSIMNAVAVGDGNVFVTRQLLAFMNDEDDLIGVMGHEVGHVIGGHSSFDAATYSAKARGDQVLGVFLPGIAAQGVNLGGTIILSGFSRAQEHSSDIAGVKFLADLGRDPAGMARSLTILEKYANLQAKMFGASPPSAFDYWLRSHPVHSERINVVQFTASMAPRGRPGQRRTRDAFIRELDGLLFDDGPHQGIVDGGQFRHPAMKIALDAPEPFKLLNGTSALLMAGPGGSSATLRMTGGSGSPAERFKAAWGKSFPPKIAAPESVASDVHGIPSASGYVDVPLKDGSSVRLSMWAYAWSDTQSFLYIAEDPKGALANQHAAAAKSFRRLTDADAAAVKIRRVKIVDLDKDDTIANLSARMAYRDHQEDRFRLINGLFDGAALPKSGAVKVVVWAGQ